MITEVTLKLVGAFFNAKVIAGSIGMLIGTFFMIHLDDYREFFINIDLWITLLIRDLLRL